MLRAIPKSLLPDTAEVQEPAGGDYGGEYSEPYYLVHVRFDANIPLLRTSYVLEDGSEGIIFVDAVNTEGAKEVPVGSLVTIRGEEHSVVKVHRFESFNGAVHHWELEVR